MKLLWPIFAILMATQAAHAEKIYCYFTEPFINLTYDSDTNLVVHSSPGNDDKVGEAEVVFNKNGSILITVVGINNSLLIDTTKPGSDGMSDFIYPFEAVVNGTLYGGCETDHIKKKLSTLHGLCAQ
ncbi:hypothetical protein B9G69_007865 [Bdellovibrio sp. SKB1291214]|uniref:hypothetical protein n=1 Tax=Bdellovibrio sp. SKB1291214 TaxID=1732569 RepID=UPI000B51784A|nr:hypothetical protein [Bdellovibrio sp. SKB1291214]UYL10490.1 hypothetical protein B9G69_007865 [Bdellovibrio sp. SKB1291214]